MRGIKKCQTIIYRLKKYGDTGIPRYFVTSSIAGQKNCNVDDHSEKPCSRYLVWKRLMKFRTGFGYRFRLVLGEPLQGSPYATGPMSRLSVLSLCNARWCLWLNGWMDQDATWCGGRPRPRRYCVRCGPSFPHGKGHTNPPLFGPCLLWPNGCASQQLLSSCALMTRCFIS